MVFWIHVTPKSRRPAVGGAHGDALRVAVGAPPSEGRANAACRELLAGALRVPAAAIEIESGQRGRRKRVRIAGGGDELADRVRGLAARTRAGDARAR